MPMEWIEPLIEKRAWEVVEICEADNVELYQSFTKHIKILQKSLDGDALKLLHKLDDLFTQRMLIVKTAYRIGLKDGLELMGSLRRGTLETSKRPTSINKISD